MRRDTAEIVPVTRGRVMPDQTWVDVPVGGGHVRVGLRPFGEYFRRRHLWRRRYRRGRPEQMPDAGATAEIRRAVTREYLGSCVLGHGISGRISGNISAQIFWEAFPASASPEQRTTYLFTYMDLDPARPSIEELFEEYWRRLPAYQVSRRENARGTSSCVSRWSFAPPTGRSPSASHVPPRSFRSLHLVQGLAARARLRSRDAGQF